MVQLSRPFQVVLAAFVLFAIAWFALLHRPSSGSSGGSSSANVATPHPHAPPRAGSGAAATHRAGSDAARGAHAAPSTGDATHVGSSSAHTVRVTHTATSGTGRTRVVVHTQHSAGAANSHVVVHTSSSGTGAHRAATHTASAIAAPHKTAAEQGHAQPTRRAPSAPAHGSPSAPANATSTPAMQATVAGELKRGKVVLLLFWEPKSTSDSAVHEQVEIVAHKLGRGVVVHTASAAQVGEFGSITRDIQVYQTPTLLIVNPKAQVTTVAGYTDAYALEQTIREARG